MTLLSTQYVQFTNDELELLNTLIRMSSDDPRVNGIQGTCFRHENSSPGQEARLKSLWTSIEIKLSEFEVAADG